MKPKAPKPSATDQARAALTRDQEQRANKCQAEIVASLERHRCKLGAQTLIFYDGRLPQIMIAPEALP